MPFRLAKAPRLPPLLLFALALLLTPAASAQADGTALWAGPFTTGGYIVSSPAIAADGTIYFGTQDNHLYAIAPDGSLEWQFPTGDWIDSSPAIGSDGTIYLGSWDGNLYAVAPDGTQKWAFSTGVGNYIYSSPAIGADGTVYFGAGDANFYALRADGSLKWSFPAGDWIDSSPAIGANGLIYFGSWDGNVHALRDQGDFADEAWRFTTNGPVLTSPALGRDGTVYVGSNDGALYALDGTTGTKRWDFQTGGTLESSPAVGPDGVIYIGGGSPYLHAINPDGTLKWKFYVTDPVVSTPAIRADGTVVFGGNDGAIHAIYPHTPPLPKWTAATGDWVDSSPVVAANGTIFVGSYDKKLYALNGSGAPVSAFSEWPMHRRDATHGARVPTPAAGGYLVNLSTRGKAGPGLNLIPGFVVGGNVAKPFLIRAVGPTLAALAVPDPLADPTFTLIAGFGSSATVVAQNDNWSASGDADQIAQLGAKTGAFPLPLPSLDSAIIANVPPHIPHTALANSTVGAPGIALVEVYDGETENASARLVNLSTRGYVGTGGEALFAGLVIGGTAPVRLVLRAIGPGLMAHGVTGVLARPTLTLFSGQTPIATNTGWTTGHNAADLSAAFDVVGAFSLGAQSADCALMVTLAPGIYTMRVAGVADTTGEGMVEVYVVP